MRKAGMEKKPFYDLALYFADDDINDKLFKETEYYKSEENEESSDLEQRNYLNFQQFFEVIEEYGAEDNIICDYNKIIRKITDKEMSFKELISVYACTDPESKEKKAKIRTLVCKHPLEWNKDLYHDSFVNKQKHYFALYGEWLTNFLNKMKKLDLWTNPKDGQKEDLPIPKGNTWFAHPIYFINHLDKAGLLDRSFNPYEGHRIERAWVDTNVTPSITLPETDVIVRNNPGFAPKFQAAEIGQSAFEGDIFSRYAVPTALFNNRNSATNENSRHAGVDFRGSPGTAIHSFIYGRVINLGWINNTNGRALVIANERDRGIYLLTHLHANTENIIRRGMRIEPDDVVAYVGQSGAPGGNRNETHWTPPNGGSHLHLEYYHVQYNANLDRTANDNPYAIVNDAGVLTLQLNLTREGGYRRNPFVHNP